MEDQGSVAAFEKMNLEMYGYSVITANSGEKAIALVNENRSIDLILMDISLFTEKSQGLMDGPEAAQVILKDHDLPLIFLSSYTNLEVVEKTEKITSYGYVVKSSGITVLDASIKMAFKLFEANKKMSTLYAKLEGTLDALPDLLFEVGLDGLIYDHHSPHAGLQENQGAQLIGKRIRDIHSLNSAEIIMTAIHEAHEQGNSFGKQFEEIVPEGNRWFEISVSHKKSLPAEPHFIILEREITDRKRDENKIKMLLHEKELILKEVHHRIKNNMNTIYGILLLQAKTLTEATTITALEDAASRVRSMMMLYDKLYQSTDVNQLALADYLHPLIDEIVANFPNSRFVTIEKKFDDCILDAKRLQLLGIIINELITNIMKYAFSGRTDGIISVCASVKKGLVSIIIEDNGNGMSEEVSFEKSTGFGLVLVQGITQQLNGKIRIERIGGTRIVLEFNQ